jgi:broad specificity phosphatase PhoE
MAAATLATVATTLVLVRHGETDWNREHRWQGHADPRLNAVGRRQAADLAERLASSSFVALYSSDLARARETAAIVAARLGLDVRLDPRLREVDVGEWSGLTSLEIEARYPERDRARRDGATPWTRGESYEAMSARVLRALDEIATAHEPGRVLVITHGGPMRAVWLAGGGKLSRWQRTSNCDLDEIAVEDGQIRWIDSTRVGGLHQQVQG